MNKEISLLESLTGVDFVIMHLDGRKIRIQSKPGEVIQPDQRKTIEDLGMPFHKTSYKNGNLFINFKIKFPNKVDEKTIKTIEEILSMQKETGQKVKEDETCHLQAFDESQKNTHVQGGTRGIDSDEEEEDDEEGGQRIGCQ